MSTDSAPRGPIPDSYWLIPGALLAGEYPGTYVEADTREKLAKFLDAGIRTFINLTEPRELTSYEHILRDLSSERGIETTHVRQSIRDYSTPRERAQMIKILATIRSEIAAGRAVYVHCWGGIGRTGTVVGCWLVEQGLTGDEALIRIAELRDGIPDSRVRSPVSDEQCRYVREWLRKEPPPDDGAGS
jgi:protein-tyrosine phosphatase